ncbi:MAG: alpha/beta hydrolase [Arcobacter sp.]|nr:MAG: alpha/beta hydrolase [Arcobacter sp.]
MVELGYKTIGSGKKIIILLHELMGDHRNYEPIIPYLDTINYTYIFVDHRGYGLSKDIKGTYSCEEASNDVKNLITKLNLKDVYLISHSMSTMIAQKIALIDNRIKSLILITPVPACGIKIASLAKNQLLKEMKENSGKIEEIVNDSSKRYNQTWRDKRIKLAYDASTVEARVGYMSMYLNTDFLDEVKNIKIPVKIIVGKYDFPIFSLKSVKRLFEPSYENLETVECQESGHYPMIECPVFFASKIEEFCK